MIIVFGSINMDVNTRLRAFPAPGETVLSPAYEMTPGGKGANQSLACARGGAKTALVGKVGDDAMSTRILNGLRRNEVMTSGVAISDYLPTGLAIVMTNAAGENQIVVAAGANADVTAEQVPDEILKPGNFVLFQMEIPLKETATLIARAKKCGATTMLNFAPAHNIPLAGLALADYLVVNEGESKAVAGIAGVEAGDPVATARGIAAKTGGICILTLGPRGAVAALRDGRVLRVAALRMTPEQIVDTTGAGDCFCGTLAAALHNKLPLDMALRRASVAAGLACQKRGAQESFPYISEIDEAMENFPEIQAA